MTQQLQLEADFPELTAQFFDNDELRIRCFLDKYALRNLDGEVMEKTPMEMWRRLARELASVETGEQKQAEWREKFLWLLQDFRFVPGGRIMFGAGQSRQATLLNCYVIPIQEDSLEGIFEWCKQAARTYSFGGGVGTDLSILRPKGAPVNNAAIYSTGSVSFMDIFSMTTGTIGQAGRRGALMITISSDHPDLLDFIEVKNDPKRTKVQFANISVRITGKFMEAVRNDSEYSLRFENEIVATFEKRVRAQEVWDKLIRSAHASAEPGLIFWDNIKRESTTEYGGMEVVTTNPCSEIPLEPYGCCCLGNINLAQFVSHEFEEGAKVDWPQVERAARYATRFLDNVLDYNADRHPLKEQKEASLWSRRIGVGFTGFGDMLIKLGLKYDSDEAIEFTDNLFEQIKRWVYDESVELAQEKGTFPAFDGPKHMESAFIQRLDDQIKKKIKEHGLRNAALLTVPPVGSGSVLAGCTSGIEPIFALKYVRKSKSLSGESFNVLHPLVRDYARHRGWEDRDPAEVLADLPQALFVTAHQIDPFFRVKMQATIQRHIDHAISSTVNLPEDTSVEDVDKIYRYGYELGCKGITVYRESSREGVLLTEEREKRNQAQQAQTPVITQATGKDNVGSRPSCLPGMTYSLMTEFGRLFVIVNRHPETGRLFELFAILNKSGSQVQADLEGLGRSCSLHFRRGQPPHDIVEQYAFIKGGRPVVQKTGLFKGEMVYSSPDAMALVLERDMLDHGDITKADCIRLKQRLIKTSSAEQVPPNDNGKARQAEMCPGCGGLLIFTNGCYQCHDCGYSECD